MKLYLSCTGSHCRAYPLPGQQGAKQIENIEEACRIAKIHWVKHRDTEEPFLIVSEVLMPPEDYVRIPRVTILGNIKRDGTWVPDVKEDPEKLV